MLGRWALGGQWEKNAGFNEVDVLLDLLGDAVSGRLVSILYL